MKLYQEAMNAHWIIDLKLYIDGTFRYSNRTRLLKVVYSFIQCVDVAGKLGLQHNSREKRDIYRNSKPLKLCLRLMLMYGSIEIRDFSKRKIQFHWNTPKFGKCFRLPSSTHRERWQANIEFWILGKELCCFFEKVFSDIKKMKLNFHFPIFIFNFHIEKVFECSTNANWKFPWN